MFLIGKMISSMVTVFLLKSKTIPNSFMDLHPMMRLNTGLPISLSYSTISGSARNCLLLEYSKNLMLAFPPPFVWKTPFYVCQDCGTCLAEWRKCFAVPFSWNSRSPSEPLSRSTLRSTFFLSTFLLLLREVDKRWADTLPMGGRRTTTRLASECHDSCDSCHLSLLFFGGGSVRNLTKIISNT
jgi:hypothetical protein